MSDPIKVLTTTLRDHGVKGAINGGIRSYPLPHILVYVNEEMIPLTKEATKDGIEGYRVRVHGPAHKPKDSTRRKKK